MRFVLPVIAAVLLASPAAAANLITNGSFETGPNPGGFTTLSAGNGALTGWTINSGSIDYIGNYWNAADGNRSVDMNGNGPATISQSFATVAGRAYTLSFATSANPDNAITKILNYSVGALSGSISNSVIGRPLVWTPHSFSFVATGSTSTLSFSAGMGGPFGMALDAVSVAGVPEPGTWAMLLVGFGMVGLGARRRRLAAA